MTFGVKGESQVQIQQTGVEITAKSLIVRLGACLEAQMCEYRSRKAGWIWGFAQITGIQDLLYVLAFKKLTVLSAPQQPIETAGADAPSLSGDGGTPTSLVSGLHILQHM